MSAAAIVRNSPAHWVDICSLDEIAPDTGVCALLDGRAVETTLGFSALDGLCMGTRCGSVDPGAVLHLVKERSLSASEVETILYRRSGLLGISGLSADLRVLLESDAPRARLAVEYFLHRATKEIGALVAVLGGLDTLVFTAGIGENSAPIRRMLCARLRWLGVELDEKANAQGERRISSGCSRVAVRVIPSDEEGVIARHTAKLIADSTARTP